jgi:hypothetical protein
LVFGFIAIHYYLPERAHVTLDIYDVSGKRIYKLLNFVQDAGKHHVEWSRRNQEGIIVSSGICFHKLTAGKKGVTRKMILMR